MRQEALAELMAEMVRRPVEISIEGLIARLQPAADGLLGKVTEIAKYLELCKILVLPDLSTGEIDTPRLLQLQQLTNAISPDEVEAIIRQGESAELEFKSTLLFNIKMENQKPGLDAANYKSEDVLHSTLKTIAAFLNSSGGVLLVGVADNQEIIGIEKDHCFSETNNTDQWELHLRNCITGRFKDGAAVNDYVRVSPVVIEGKTVIHVKVLARKALCVVKDHKGNSKVYRRQGNRTDAVDYFDIAEFIELRRDK